MQDFNYLHTNCFEITIELGCEKFPSHEVLPAEWRSNKEPFLLYMDQVKLVNFQVWVWAINDYVYAFMTQVHCGIKGVVQSDAGVAIEGAVIRVHFINHDVTSSNSSYILQVFVINVTK